MVPRAGDLIRIARSHLDVIENPIGSNNGPKLRAFLRDTPWQPGQAWCYYAMLACALETWGSRADLPPSIAFVGSCEEAASTASKLGMLSTEPATGAIFLLHDPVRHYHHAGLVVNIHKKYNVLETVEGNTSNDGSREGYRMMARARHNIDLSFIIW